MKHMIAVIGGNSRGLIHNKKLPIHFCLWQGKKALPLNTFNVGVQSQMH